MAARFCPACGAPARPDDVFCGQCGGALVQTPASQGQPAPTPPPSGRTRPTGPTLATPYSLATGPATGPARTPAAAAVSGVSGVSGVGTRALTLGAPAASGGRAFGVTLGAIGLALCLLLIATAAQADPLHAPRLDALSAVLVPAPLVLVVAFGLGVVLLGFWDTARAWLTAICATQVLFGLAAILEMRAFLPYLHQASLVPTMTLAASRPLVLGATCFHTLTACLLGMGLAQVFAPWERLRARGRSGAGGWLMGALIAAILALLAESTAQAVVFRLALAGLGAGGRWLLAVALTGVLLVLVAAVAGAAGWALAREPR